MGNEKYKKRGGGDLGRNPDFILTSYVSTQAAMFSEFLSGEMKTDLSPQEGSSGHSWPSSSQQDPHTPLLLPSPRAD